MSSCPSPETSPLLSAQHAAAPPHCKSRLASSGAARLMSTWSLAPLLQRAAPPLNPKPINAPHGGPPALNCCHPVPPPLHFPNPTHLKFRAGQCMCRPLMVNLCGQLLHTRPQFALGLPRIGQLLALLLISLTHHLQLTGGLQGSSRTCLSARVPATLPALPGACKEQGRRAHEVCLLWLFHTLNDLQGTLWEGSLQAATRSGSLALSQQT